MKTRPSAGGSMDVPVHYQSREPSVAQSHCNVAGPKGAML